MGSCIRYVEAAITLIKSDDRPLMDAVMRGDISILAAAEAVEPFVMMLDGFKKSSPKNRDDFFAATGCTNDLGQHLVASSLAERTRAAARLGTAQVWDTMLNPLLKAAE